MGIGFRIQGSGCACPLEAPCFRRSASRTLVVCGHRVVLSTLLLKGLPLASYAGRDAQSDQEASWVLSANLLSLQSWDSPGMMLFMLLMSLTTGLWLGAAAFTPRELLHNALSGFYLVLLCISEAWARNDGGQWQSFFFHRTTCKNLLYVTAHLIERHGRLVCEGRERGGEGCVGLCLATISDPACPLQMSPMDC